MRCSFVLAVGLSGVLSLGPGASAEVEKSEAVYLTDMGKCVPADALSPVPAHKRWYVVKYDAGKIKGNMLAGLAYAKAPEVRLPLNLTGWHAVSVGFWPGIYEDSTVRYRLSNEPAFTVVHQKQDFQWARTDLIETFPKYADLTGVESMVFAKHGMSKACIAYVRLEPLSDEKVREIQEDRRRTDTRSAIQLMDAYGMFARPWPLRTADALRELVEGYRHSDFQKVMWCAASGDMTFYRNTKIGRFHATNDVPSPRVYDKEIRDAHNSLDEAGIANAFDVVLKHSHDVGLEFHLYYRLAMADHGAPIAWFSTESFWLKQHPQYRMLAKDGTPMGLGSYAFPAVRDFMVSLIAEGMQYDIDGVNLCLIRGPEYFGYEQPVIDDFKKLYGLDPRELPDHDERLEKLRTGYMTEFIRAVRAAADKRGAERGRRIQVSTYVESSDERMQYFGYDCYGWIEEKLVDFVMCGSAPPKLLALAKKTGCKVYMQSGQSASAVVGAMKGARSGGYAGLWFWDGFRMPFGAEDWHVISRLGHEAEMKALPDDAKSYPKMKRTKVLSIGGHELTKTVSKKVPGGWPPEMLTLFTGG